MPQRIFGQTGVGRILPVTRIIVESKRGPVIPAFFTFNRQTLRFEMWGSPSYPENIPFTSDNEDTLSRRRQGRNIPGVLSDNSEPSIGTDPATVPTGAEWHTYNPSMEELVQDGTLPAEAWPEWDPDTFDWGAIVAAGNNRGVNWPWWRPRGYHIYYSGNKLDDAMENPDPGKGNLGLREGPFIGPNWHWGDSEGGRHELYLGCQIPQIGQRHGGIPEAYWDLAGRVGYRYNPPAGQMCGFGLGIGTYFQWTNDEVAGGQSNPWGQTIGPHHLDPYVEVVVDWDWGDVFQLPGEGAGADYKISIELGYDGDIRGGVTLGF